MNPAARKINSSINISSFTKCRSVLFIGPLSLQKFRNVENTILHVISKLDWNRPHAKMAAD